MNDWPSGHQCYHFVEHFHLLNRELKLLRVTISLKMQLMRVKIVTILDYFLNDGDAVDYDGDAVGDAAAAADGDGDLN